VDKDGKRHGQADPEGAHEHGLFERNPAAFAAYDRKVKKQQEENYGIEDNPKPDMHGGLAADRSQGGIAHAAIISG
jgi:hypothetical protein